MSSNKKQKNEIEEINNSFSDANEDLNEKLSEEESFNEDLIFDEEDNKIVDAENLEDFREKVKQSGVVYISSIPEGMTVQFIRQSFETYGVTRIYLEPLNKTNKKDKKKQNYKEGWVEFSNKLMAKLCEYELNGKVIGGKRNLPFREDLWTIKYLHKFKWHHLIEKISFNKKLREQRMKAEITQARREANFIEEKFEQSKIMNKKIKKRERENEELNENGNVESEKVKVDNTDDRFSQDKFKEFKRNFKQRTPIFK